MCQSRGKAPRSPPRSRFRASGLCSSERLRAAPCDSPFVQDHGPSAQRVDFQIPTQRGNLFEERLRMFPTTTASLVVAAALALALVLAVQGQPQAAPAFEIAGIRG